MATTGADCTGSVSATITAMMSGTSSSTAARSKERTSMRALNTVELSQLIRKVERVYRGENPQEGARRIKAATNVNDLYV
jgi:hypothetical protein